jgi:predicted ATPase
MRLVKLRVQHFKSLADVAVSFDQPITVLVGPNAVGKSNIVDALRFVRDAVSTDLEHAISSRGGIARIRQNTSDSNITVNLQLDIFESTESTTPSSYAVRLDSVPPSNYVVDAEQATYLGFLEADAAAVEAPVPTHFVRNREGSIEIGGRKQRGKCRPDELALGHIMGVQSPLGWGLRGIFTDLRFSTLLPNILRQPSVPDKDNALSEDGANWASVIKAMRGTTAGMEALNRVFSAMRTVLPSFREVTVSAVGSYLVPVFHFDPQQSEPTEFDPSQLSDGTLRIFGILLALYQIPAPQFLVIEEPEQTVHPGALGVLAEAFREASETTQIVITTHSPHLIDYFKPEEVRVVTLEGGVTRVSPIKRTQIEAVKRRLMSLQDFMLAEGLQPELQ